MSKMRRALSALLAVIMVLSMFTVGTFAADEKDTYSIVINYVFKDSQKTAAPSWTATVSNGSSLTQDVASPAVVGYTPDSAVVKLNHTNIKEDITITVEYSPAQVNFTVKHYLQNVDDDKYTLAKTETKQGYTEAAVGDALKDTQYDGHGFTALLYDATTKIAADGSTVVEIYYDRNYYLLSLDLDGGFGAEPVYARYGAPISVADPEKPGYTFGGWSETASGTKVTLPSAMPAGNKTYHAIWIPADTAKVTVVIWGENANDEQYSYYESIETTGKPGEKFTPDLDHSLICYGLSAGISATTPDPEATKYFQKLGLDNGKIYYFNDNGRNNKGDKYYLYLNGEYYEYSSKPSDNLGVELGQTEFDEGWLHSTDYFYKYEVKTTCRHPHMDDTSLWKFVRSDTVTVAADGTTVVNVYYDRVEKTLHFRKTNSSKDDYGTITAKWGADIDEAYKAILKKANNNSFWSENSSGNQPYTNYIGIMPKTDKTYYNSGRSGSDGTMSYYFEDINGNYPSTPGFTVSGVGGYFVTIEDRYEFEGFTFSHGTDIDSSCSGAEFYYARNKYLLTFNDGLTDINSKTVKYKAGLGQYDFTPTMPTNLYEAGSRVFGGWYLNPECTGEEYKLDEHTMPAANVILYAKWVPVTHTVRTFLTEDAVGGTPLDTFLVPHGSTVENPPADPTNGNYDFVGWFYKENGVEKAFDFSMAITKDLDLYAKWSSNVLVEYTIKYQLENNATQIADDTKGSALAGTSKTFDAKGGDELYINYREGYFPKTSSHNVTMDINGNNQYIFQYVQKDAVPYTVKYVDAATGEELDSAKTVNDNRSAIVTEKYKVISGYMPDAVYKRLVVSADEPDKNVIIFYYTKDESHAPVTVNHWTQTADGSTYVQRSTMTFTGNIGDTYNANSEYGPIAIAGFTYNANPVKQLDDHPARAVGELTNGGLELNFYYDRIECEYVVKHVDFDDETIIKTESSKALYDSTVTGYQGTFNGYMPIEGQPAQKQITIGTGTNEIIFYYYKCFYVGHVQTTLKNTDSIRWTRDSKYSLTNAVTSGYLYGGAFTNEACGVDDVKAFEKGENAISFTPEKGETYYIWEVDQKYLVPKTCTVWVSYNNGTSEVVQLYLMTAIDRLLYNKVGFNVVDMLGEPSTRKSEADGKDVAYGVVNATKKNGELSKQIYVNDGLIATSATAVSEGARDKGYIGMYHLTDEEFAEFTSNKFIFTPYWVTLDGIKVTGVLERTCGYIERGNNATGIQIVGGKDKNVSSDVAPVSSPSTQSLMFVAAYSYDANPDSPVDPIDPIDPIDPVDPPEAEIVVTIHDDDSVYELNVEPGEDITDRVTYSGTGLFAGWYTDDAYTVPADLTDVTESMSIYAKYVSDGYLQVKYVAQGLFRVRGITLISAVEPDMRESGFIVNGEKVDSISMGRRINLGSAGYLFDVDSDALLMVGNYSLWNTANGEEIEITPYWVTADGTTVYGTTRVLTYTRYGLEG